MKKTIFVAFFTTVAFVTTQCQASIIGETIRAEWVYPNVNNSIESHDIVAVDPGVELTASDIQNSSFFEIDILPSQILFTFNSSSNWQNQAANGWRFTDLNDTLPDIVGYTINSVSGATGVDQADLSFTANSVFGNFGNSGAGGRVVTQAGATILLDVHFASAQVPEPGTIIIWSVFAATGLLCGSRRRREVA